MQAALDTLITDGYLQLSERGVYHFAHDKVEEAASLLKPAATTLGNEQEDASSFHKWVGEILLAGLQSHQLESAVFVVVNLLNEGDVPDDVTGRVELAKNAPIR